MENFKTISKQLNKGSFSILHLNMRSRNKNTDKLRELQASLDGYFSAIALTESWREETANENCLLDLENNYSVHQTKKNREGAGVCIYIRKNISSKARSNIDLLDEEIEISSTQIEIDQKKFAQQKQI